MLPKTGTSEAVPCGGMVACSVQAPRGSRDEPEPAALHRPTGRRCPRRSASPPAIRAPIANQIGGSATGRKPQICPVIARSLEKRDVPSPFPWGFILPFGVAQLVSWGSFYYAFTLFLAPMEHELGWHKTGLSAAYSLGIGVAGLCAPLVG